MIFIDTDVFVIDLRYHRDPKYPVNSQFLRVMTESRKATTSYYNVLETCGILSFNLNRKQLYELYHYMPRKYNLHRFTPLKPGEKLPSFRISALLDVIAEKTSFGDAQVICAARDMIDELSCFVSWNADHFKEKLPCDAITPSDYLARQAGAERIK